MTEHVMDNIETTQRKISFIWKILFTILQKLYFKGRKTFYC